MEFNIKELISKLKDKRKIFVSEADFQFELAWTIKEKYPDSKVRLEFCPKFAPNMHIDILVIIDNDWIPIELKYKTKKIEKEIDNEIFNLKNQAASDQGCYAYLKDIQRIENIREYIKVGYTVFITNDLVYVDGCKKGSNYEQFSLQDKAIKNGRLDWKKGTSAGTKKGCESPIHLEGTYDIKWQDYSNIDGCKFFYLINEIRGKKL